MIQCAACLIGPSAEMKELVIFGVGDIAELANFYFENDSNRRIAAFTIDGSFIKEDTFCKKPVIAFDDVLLRFPPESHDIFIAVSYTKLNSVRTEKVESARKLGYGLASYVSTKATVFPGFIAEENVFILEDNTIQPFARVGKNVTLWSGNHVGHHSKIDDNCFIASHVVISGGVTIGKNCFVGVNVTIRDHVKIGERCVLGAGALILSDAPDESVFSPGATERAKVPSSRLRGI